MAQIFRILFLLSLSTFSSLESRKIVVHEDPPEISILLWIGSDLSSEDYIKTQVAHDLDMEAPVTLVNKTTYILTSEVTLISFMCKSSSYPVSWEFSNSKWLLMQERTFGMYITTSRRTAEDIDNPKTFTYWSELVLLGDSRMYNGKYSCKSIVEDHISTDILVFWEGGPFNNVFPLAEKNLTVYVDTSGPHDKVIFPCHVNNPFAEVSLKRENPIIIDSPKNQTDNQTQIDPWILADTTYLTFIAEIGFIYENPNINDYPDSSTIYKCSISDDNELDQVYITLINGQEPIIELDNPIHSNATIDKISTGYQCCSSSAVPPILLVHSCGDPVTCNELIIALKAQQSSITSTSKMSASINHIWISSLSSYFSPKNGSCTSYRSFYSQFDVDMVQCIGDGINVLRKFYPRNTQNISYDDWNEETLQKSINLVPQRNWRNKGDIARQVEGKPDVYEVYLGTSVIFKCQASFYFFSYGMRFSTENHDGSKLVLPDLFEEEEKKRFHIKVLYLNHNPPLTVTENVTIHLYTKSLTCHVPVTNSSEWIKKTIHFNVKHPETPSIISKDGLLTESIVWIVNDTDKILTCETKADPEPRVIWTKDNVPATPKYNVSRQGTTYTLRVPKVTHDVHGEFKCIAMNFAGSIEKTFTVYVEETASGAHAVVIVIAVIIILGILAGIAFLARKTYLQKKSLENLREHVYPQQDVN